MTSFPIAIPTTPGFQKVTLNLTPASSVTKSPFSFSSQSYDFGGRMWEALVVLPPMSRSQARLWKAFFLLLVGNYGTFTMGKVVDAAPLGTASSATTSEDCPAGSNSVTVTGLGAGNTLLAGDFFSVSNRLYMITEDMTADGSGNGTINFEPPARADIPNGTAMTLASPQGTWRMSAPVNKWTDDQMLTTAMTFACEEAL